MKHFIIVKKIFVIYFAPLKLYIVYINQVYYINVNMNTIIIMFIYKIIVFVTDLLALVQSPDSDDSLIFIQNVT